MNAYAQTRVSDNAPPGLLPEERLLVALAKLRPVAGDLRQALAAAGEAGFCWERTFSLAERHGVHPALAYNLERVPELLAQIPAELRPVMMRARLDGQVRPSLYAQALAPVLTELAQEGIPLALMKGAALVATLYPAGTRLLNDLDVLIHRHDYSRVAAALEAAGFQKQLKSRFADERQQLDRYHEMEFVKESPWGPLSVDLHWQMFPRNRHFFLDTSDLLARAVPVRWGKAPVLALSAEDTLIQYAGQLAIDRLSFSFARVADISALVSDSLDWDLLSRTAHDAGAERVLRLALGLATTLGARLPHAAEQQAAAAFAKRDFAAMLFADPRWFFGRSVLPASARYFLLPLLYDGVLYRLAHPVIVFRRRYRDAKSGGCRRPQALLQAGSRSLLDLSGAALWGSRLAAARTADALGAHRLAAHLGDALWRPRTAPR